MSSDKTRSCIFNFTIVIIILIIVLNNNKHFIHKKSFQRRITYEIFANKLSHETLFIKKKLRIRHFLESNLLFI